MNIWGSQIHGGQFRRRHVGSVREGLAELGKWVCSDRTAALEQAKLAVIAASEDLWGRDDGKIVDHLASVGILKGIARQALALAHNQFPGKELSRWNVGWGLTRASQSFGMDRRFELDRVAGQLVFSK